MADGNGAGEAFEPPAREAMEFDVVVVGAGPAGLAAAIRLRQLKPDLSVVVLEKSSEVGAHILSGVVMDPVGLDALLPEWRSDEDRPLKLEVADDRFYYLGPAGGMRLPNALMPKLMSNHGNFVGSLARNTGSGSRNSGRCRPRRTGRGSCSIPSAGRSATAPAAARSSTAWRTTSCRSASWST